MYPPNRFLDPENVPKEHEELELVKMQIMYKNSTTRILHFTNHDESVRVKHVVPFGSIPWTSTPNSHSVIFHATHRITIVTKVGGEDQHHVYSVLRPRYRFENAMTRRSFQRLARERDLKGEFTAYDMEASALEGDKIVAKNQVVRLWSKRWEGGGTAVPDVTKLPTITMSFLATGLDDGQTHQEWDLREFKHQARFVPQGLQMPWKKTVPPSDTIELHPLSPESPWGRVKIRLESIKGM